MATLSLAVLTTACTKQDEKPQEPNTETKTEVKADTPPAPTPEPAKPSEAHKHDHAGHDHSHSHAHDHAHHHAPEDAVAYQCGDKTIHIALHDHDGEKEAHITADNITYDLAEDVQSKNRYTTDDGIEGDKGMALILDGNNAKVSTLDDKVLLECTKAS